MYFVKAKGLLSSKNGMNIYRGCTHGCIYCDSRSKCYQIRHRFEDIEVKENAPELLEQALRSKRRRTVISTGAMTDPYIPAERELRLMRQCLEIILKYGFGVNVLTKSDLILRDIDLLRQINQKARCVVQMTLTTFDEDLCSVLEPNVCTTARRYEVLKIFHENNIPTVVWLCPILPFINDTEENINGILDYCIQAKVYGIICFDMGLTLREGNREHYYACLDKYFPGLRQKYTCVYGDSYEISSENSSDLMKLLKKRCDENGIVCDIRYIFDYLRRYEEKVYQLNLFDIFK